MLLIGQVSTTGKVEGHDCAGLCGVVLQTAGGGAGGRVAGDLGDLDVPLSRAGVHLPSEGHRVAGLLCANVHCKGQ